MDDIRIYKGKAIHWKGNGTYYLIEKLGIWCRVQSIQVLDMEVSKGTPFAYIAESETQKI